MFQYCVIFPTVLNMVMYADDTTLISSLETFGKISEPRNLEHAINEEINKISIWLRKNELLLNVGKSKFMIYF